SSSHVPPQHAFRQNFNSPAAGPPISDKQLSKEFMDASIHKGPDPFAFNNFSRDLQNIPRTNPSSNAWSSEFHAAPPNLIQNDLHHLNAAFNNASISNHPSAQAQPQNPQLNLSKNPVLLNNQPAAYGGLGPMYNQFPQQFYGQQSFPLYNQVRPSITDNSPSISQVSLKDSSLEDVLSDPNNSSDLAHIAKKIISSTQYSNNPKIKDSEFFKLLHDLSNNSSSIQISAAAPVSSSPLHTTSTAANKSSSAAQDSWSSQFAAHVSSNFDPQPEILNNGNIVSEKEAVSLERNWSEEFEKSLDGPLKETFVAGNMEDFDAELAKVENEIKVDVSGFDNFESQMNANIPHLDRDAVREDWIKQYKSNIESLMKDSDYDWENQRKLWRDMPTGYRAEDPAYNDYKFFSQNPLSSMPSSEIVEIINQVKADPSSKSLADTILALESALQNDPSNAELWTMLGIKQQENEREDAAIAALRKAISIDPNSLDAYMAIAVSYTNENYYLDAYQSFYEWISRHPEYSKSMDLTNPQNNLKRIEDPNTRQDYIQGLFLNAARQRPGNDWDPDVQVALGVIFNISEEYNKAVDCFKAALSKRPDDYMTWNKLGATLANNQNPQRATDAYFNALEIHPSYIRARYNLAIASINMKQYQEAAEYLLGSLSLQKKDMVSVPSGSGSGGFVPAVSMSSIIWDTLKTIMYALNEPQLAESTDRRDLEVFRTKFSF
ncbi:Peroxisomal targeting signal 1 receptor, partial [Smittium mucronatum]